MKKPSKADSTRTSNRNGDPSANHMAIMPYGNGNTLADNQLVNIEPNYPYQPDSRDLAVTEADDDEQDEKKTSAFLLKTFNMVSDPSNSHIVCWNTAGDEFVVKNEHEFASTILPVHFRHKNFSSFVRQLNFYGFSKRSTPNQHSHFKHPNFRRNRRDLQPQIKRKMNEQAQNVNIKDALSTLQNQVMDLQTKYKETWVVQQRILSLLSKVLSRDHADIRLPAQTFNYLNSSKEDYQLDYSDDSHVPIKRSLAVAQSRPVKRHNSAYPVGSYNHPTNQASLSPTTRAMYEGDNIPNYPQLQYTALNSQNPNKNSDNKIKEEKLGGYQTQNDFLKVKQLTEAVNSLPQLPPINIDSLQGVKEIVDSNYNYNSLHERNYHAPLYTDINRNQPMIASPDNRNFYSGNNSYSEATNPYQTIPQIPKFDPTFSHTTFNPQTTFQPPVHNSFISSYQPPPSIPPPKNTALIEEILDDDTKSLNSLSPNILQPTFPPFSDDHSDISSLTFNPTSRLQDSMSIGSESNIPPITSSYHDDISLLSQHNPLTSPFLPTSSNIHEQNSLTNERAEIETKSKNNPTITEPLKKQTSINEQSSFPYPSEAVLNFLAQNQMKDHYQLNPPIQGLKPQNDPGHQRQNDELRDLSSLPVPADPKLYPTRLVQPNVPNPPNVLAPTTNRYSSPK